jgi:excisionase family DNA binding protein
MTKEKGKDNLKDLDAGYTIQECYRMMFLNYDDVVTPDEVATMMHLPSKRIYRMLRSGELNSIRSERSYRIPKLGWWSTSRNTACSDRRASGCSAGRRSRLFARRPKAANRFRSFWISRTESSFWILCCCRW